MNPNERDFTLVNEGFLNRQDVPSDMWDHMGVIRRFARGADSIVEFGTSDRANSTFALMAGHPRWMRCYDVHRYEPTFSYVEKAARDAGIDFAFMIQSSTAAEIDDCDLLFIDDDHKYEHVKRELEMQGKHARKWIILHDTSEFESHDDTIDRSGRGIWPAITEYMDATGQWEIREKYNQNYGITVLQRKGCISTISRLS